MVEEPEKANQQEEEYLYRSAGIRERHGLIPWWLHLVVVALLIWSLYYMLEFWNAG
jgi:hypothetical protein